MQRGPVEEEGVKKEGKADKWREGLSPRPSPRLTYLGRRIGTLGTGGGISFIITRDNEGRWLLVSSSACFSL